MDQRAIFIIILGMGVVTYLPLRARGSLVGHAAALAGSQ